MYISAKIYNGDALKTSTYLKVWDLPIRLFHWLLVFAIVLAYVSAKYHVGKLHALTGYGLCVLLLLRVFWGLVGSRYARFKSFMFSPVETMAYLSGMLNGKPRHYLGHNPAGALMVIALLLLLALIVSTGLMTLALIDFSGPLLAVTRHFDDQSSYVFRHVHEFLVNTGLVLVLLHLLGVLFGSIQHRENLVRAMITGKKTLPSHVESD